MTQAAAGAGGAQAGAQLSLDSSGVLGGGACRGAGSAGGGCGGQRLLGARASIKRTGSAGSAGDAEWGADGRMMMLGTGDLNIPFRDLKFIRTIGAGAPGGNSKHPENEGVCVCVHGRAGHRRPQQPLPRPQAQPQLWRRCARPYCEASSHTTSTSSAASAPVRPAGLEASLRTRPGFHGAWLSDMSMQQHLLPQNIRSPACAITNPIKSMKSDAATLSFTVSFLKGFCNALHGQ